tara:strand:+ start:293798 stop:294010 length:213 start_codon:yes stop_codon:yes gene_type:complete
VYHKAPALCNFAWGHFLAFGGGNSSLHFCGTGVHSIGGFEQNMQCAVRAVWQANKMQKCGGRNRIKDRGF